MYSYCTYRPTFIHYLSINYPLLLPLPRLPGLRWLRATSCQRPSCVRRASVLQGQAESDGMVLAAYAGPVRSAAALRVEAEVDLEPVFGAVRDPAVASVPLTIFLQLVLEPAKHVGELLL